MVTNTLVPMVIQSTSQGERAMDIYSMLLNERIIFVQGVVETNMANTICAQLLYLEYQSRDKPISLYINSPGGSVVDGLAIYNTMQFITCPVHTIVIGQAASMGSFLAQAGAPGHRYVLPESRTMIHRVSSGTHGTSGSVHIQEMQFEDAKAAMDESKRLNERLTQIYAQHNTVGKTYEQLFEDMKFDKFFNAEEAVKFGLADKVLDKR